MGGKQPLHCVSFITYTYFSMFHDWLYHSLPTVITIGFNQSEYSVLESQGFVTVTVLILDGKIRSPRVVEFSLSTVVLIGDTAEGKYLIHNGIVKILASLQH